MKKSSALLVFIISLIIFANFIFIDNTKNDVNFIDTHFKDYLIQLHHLDELKLMHGGYKPNLNVPEKYIDLENRTIKQGYLDGFISLTIGVDELQNLEGFNMDLTEVIEAEKRITKLDDLNNFKNLMDLQINNIHVETLPSFTKDIKLKQLEIKKTNITDLSPLDHINTLETLSLEETKVSSIEVINNLTNLKILKFTNNTQITDYPLVGMNNLKGLKIFNGEIPITLTLKDLPNLEGFIIQGVHLNNLYLKNLPNLSSIEISGVLPAISEQTFETINSNKLESISITGENEINQINFINSFPNLRLLRITYTQSIEEIFIDENHLNSNLAYIDLSNNQLTRIAGLEHLKNLRGVALNHNEVDDISFLFDEEYQFILQNLESLELEGNKIPQWQIDLYEPLLKEHFGNHYEIGVQK